MRPARVLLAAVVIGTLPAALSCNRRVFTEVQSSCDVTISNSIDVPTNKAADILIVVDNSGSMAEEQANLVANFLNQHDGVATDNPPGCPLQDLKNIPAQYKNPIRDLYTGTGDLAACGFIQLLAAFDSDFHVGVITSTVGLCDNALPAQQGGAFCGANPGAPQCNQTDGGGWGFRPQRGCLQPNGPPGTLQKVIAASDLTDADNTNDDFAQRFKDTLDNVSTQGSPYERELDAAAIFLGQETSLAPNPSCTGDLDLFRRADAALTVIFISDEEDCSHGLGDSTFDDELVGKDGQTPHPETCGEFTDLVVTHQPGSCYSNINGVEGPATTLTPIDNYKTALLAADPNIKVAVIAGGIGDPGSITPQGCVVGADGKPSTDVGGTPCHDSGGSSNVSLVGEICGPEGDDAQGVHHAAGADFPCCTADPNTRYFGVADAIGKKATDSICNASFRSTMLDIAALIAAVDFIELAEKPASPSAIIVQETKAGTTEPNTITHLSDSDNCATTAGWKLEGDTRIDLCGAARPGPGDNISVQAEGTGVIAGCN